MLEYLSRGVAMMTAAAATPLRDPFGAKTIDPPCSRHSPQRSRANTGTGQGKAGDVLIPTAPG